MNFTEFSDFFNTVMADNGFSPLDNEAQSRKFYFLMQHMLEVGKTMNLTAIKEEKAIIVRHFLDSLTVEPFLPKNAKILDVGCGAGFPCLPLGIFRPDLAITALDSTEKRINYVQSTANSLEIPHFTAISARAEELAHDLAHRAQYDVVTARAVAALPVLAELCLPFVRLGGSFVAMKAKRGEEELAAAERAIARLGGAVIQTKSITLVGEGEGDERLLIEIKKVKPTPADLPRPYARILKKPL
jgi:16S rRNA (guanine527-N7)-methyltransferase